MKRLSSDSPIDGEAIIPRRNGAYVQRVIDTAVGLRHASDSEHPGDPGENRVAGLEVRSQWNEVAVRKMEIGLRRC